MMERIKHAGMFNRGDCHRCITVAGLEKECGDGVIGFGCARSKNDSLRLTAEQICKNISVVF